MKEYEFHEAANIFPLDEEHLDELADDIREQGQQVAIELFDGKILDGRRRYLACGRAKKQPRFVEVDVTDPVDYVVSLNIQRRHLTASQLSMCAGRATKLKEKNAAAAKERMSAGGKAAGKYRPQGEVNLPHPEGRAPQTRDQMGKAFGISGKSAEFGAKVAAKGTPALQAAVDKNLLAVSTAARAASLSPAEQDAVAERAFQAAAEGKKPRSRPAADRQNGQQVTTHSQLGIGTIRADEAIDCLRRIPKNDALREEGFDKVEDWIGRNRKVRAC